MSKLGFHVQGFTPAAVAALTSKGMSRMGLLTRSTFRSTRSRRTLNA